MRPTLQFLTDCFCKFNDEIFRSSLPTPRLSVNKNRSRLGQLTFRITRRIIGKPTYSHFELSVSNVFDREQCVWEDTIIHEMIHLYIHANGYTDTSAHGEIFRAVMQKINRQFGRHINITARLSADERDTDTARRHHYICVLTLSDGRTALACVARSRLFELWNRIPEGFDCTTTTWYLSTNPYFNRYRRVMTCKVYIVDNPDELENALTDARHLQRDGDKIYVARHRQ